MPQPDTITVKFGGRGVVLRRYQQWYRLDLIGLVFTVDLIPPDKDCHPWQANAFNLCFFGDSPQAAVSSVESKLRELRDSINKVLGD